MTFPSEAIALAVARGPARRARRGTVRVELPQIAVQLDDAASIVGLSHDTLARVPWRVLPFARHGRQRWYLVRHLNVFAERLMAMRIARGEPAHMESLLALAAHLPPMESQDDDQQRAAARA